MLVKPSQLQQLPLSDGEDSFCDLYFNRKDSSDTDYGWCGTGRRHRPQAYEHIDQKNNNDFTLWLKTRHMLSTINTETESDKIVLSCLDKIGKSVLNGLQNILTIVIDEYKHDYSSLKQINSIINNEILSEQSIIKHPIKSLFDSLSTSSILNICTYLKRTDISSFKLVSYDIGLVCLHHMNRYRFGICNANKLIEYPLFYKNIHFLDYNKLLNYNVYNGYTQIHSLQQQFENIYNIPMKYQFFVRKRAVSKVFDTSMCSLKDIPYSHSEKQIECIGDLTIKKRRYFLFDTRTVVVISDEKHVRLTTENDKQNNDIFQQYKLQFLQYFDIKKQILFTIQTLLIHKDVTCETVLKYINNSFISTCNQQKKWYHKFKNKIKEKLILFKVCNEANGFQHKDIAIHLLDSHDKILNKYDKESRIGILIFQINTNNNKIKKQLYKLESEYKMNGMYFCKNIYDFYEKLTTSFFVNVFYFHDIEILSCHLKYLCAEHHDIDVNDIIHKIKDIKFEQNTFTTYGDVRIKISNLMNGFVKPYNIQLYYNNRVLPFNQPTGCWALEIYFEFVSYDTRNIVFHKPVYHSLVTEEMESKAVIKHKHIPKLYHINIFKHDEYLIPIFDTSNNIKKIIVRYCDKIKVDNKFIGYVMHEIAKPIYGCYFNDILELFKQNINCDKNGNILYALHLNYDISNMHEKLYFSVNDNEYVKCREGLDDQLNINEMNLILYKNPFYGKSNHRLKTVPIVIRVWLRKLLFDHFSEDICGIPVKLYLKSGQSNLKEFIDRISVSKHVIKINVYKERKYDKFMNHISEISIKEFKIIDMESYQPISHDLFIIEIQFDACMMYQTLCSIRNQIKVML